MDFLYIEKKELDRNLEKKLRKIEHFGSNTLMLVF